ncbi:Monothiol glutaredoxin-S4 [Capsicum annuum]|nr:Monothiol glutaredoxin-S4 [Capsicum annuum]KAF3651730.1 Monothiol glutaredoxin-S4 [Capsicum annuum]
MDVAMKLGASSAVVIFTKSSCCISHTIETLIRSFGANPTVYELDTHLNGKQMEKALIELGCQPSVPAIFIGKELVGGANEIMSLNVRGKLKQLLIRANAIWFKVVGLWHFGWSSKLQQVTEKVMANKDTEQMIEMHRAWANGLPPPPFPTDNLEYLSSLPPVSHAQFPNIIDTLLYASGSTPG